MSSVKKEIKQAFPAGMAEKAGRRLVDSVRSDLQAGRATLLSTSGLRISAVKTVVDTTTLCKFVAGSSGTLGSIASSTDMAALVGTVDNGDFNVFCFFVAGDGTLTSAMGTAGATLGAVVFPAFTATEACLGFVIVNPTGTGDFVGGTTDLDDGTVVPNAVYVDTPFPFTPETSAALEA